MATKEYWLERQQNNVYKNSIKLADRQLKKVYQQAYFKMEKELTNIWLDMLQDGEVSIDALLKSNRFNKLMQTVDKELKQLGKTTNFKLEEHLLETFKDTYINASKQYGVAEVNYGLLQEQTGKQLVNASYKNAIYSDRVWDNLSSIRSRIEKSITDTAILGTDVRKASKALEHDMGVSFSDAKRIVITETDRVLQETTRVTAIERGYETYHILIEEDACEDCITDFTNKTFNLNESVLPNHPFCKCTMVVDIN
jgi:hypothetical protein